MHFDMYVTMRVVAVSTIMVLIVAGSITAFADTHGIPTCSLTQFDPNCSPSGWMAFILGDIVIAIALAAIFFLIGRLTNTRIGNTTEKIEAILKLDTEARKRRTIFSCQMLKDGFSVVLVSIGLMNMQLKAIKDGNDITNRIKEEHEMMVRTITTLHDTVGRAVEILDPILVSKIDKLLNALMTLQPKSCIGSGFAEYDSLKSAMHDITSDINEILTEINADENDTIY